MSCGQMATTGSTPQFMVDQRPRYDRRGKTVRSNQVMGKGKIIRPDKRKKAKYL